MPPIASSRDAANLATELLALFGAQAGEEARARARVSRHNGNLHNFCRWRETERLIRFMANRDDAATVH